MRNFLRASSRQQSSETALLLRTPRRFPKIRVQIPPRRVTPLRERLSRTSTRRREAPKRSAAPQPIRRRPAIRQPRRQAQRRQMTGRVRKKRLLHRTSRSGNLRLWCVLGCNRKNATGNICALARRHPPIMLFRKRKVLAQAKIEQPRLQTTAGRAANRSRRRAHGTARI